MPTSTARNLNAGVSGDSRFHPRSGSLLSGAIGSFPSRSLLAVLAVFALCLISGCDRDKETALRSHLDQWFFLGKTAFFDSHMRCTAAVIYVTVDRPRPALAVQDMPELAKTALLANGVAAIQVDGMSPAQLTDAMLLTGAGDFGRQALAASALGNSCFEGTRFGMLFHDALTRSGALLAYESENAGLLVLDPVRSMLFYVAGDVF